MQLSNSCCLVHCIDSGQADKQLPACFGVVKNDADYSKDSKGRGSIRTRSGLNRIFDDRKKMKMLMCARAAV